MGFGKDGKGVILRENRSQALGTLNNNVAILVGTALVTLERFRMIKGTIIAGVTGLTSAEGTGLQLYLADGDLTVAEVEATIEANGPLGPNDIVAMDLAERPVWHFGTVDREVGIEAVFENMTGGHNMEETIRWTFARTKAWNWVVYNLGNGLTTGAQVNIRAKHFGVWVT